MTVVFVALVLAFFFGLALLLTQPGLRHMGPLRGACVAVPTASLVFVVLWPWTVGFGTWNAQGALVFAAVGGLFPALVTILTVAANERLGPALTGALGNLAPLFAVLIAVVTLGEAPDGLQLVAVLVIVLGVMMLYLRPGAAAKTTLRWIFLLPLAAAFVRGLVQPAVKVGLADWPNPFAAVSIGYVVSALVVLAVNGLRRRGWPVAYDRKGWKWFALVGLCNGAAVFFLYQALALGPVIQVAPLVASYPVVTLLLGRLFPGIGGGIAPATWLGVGLTVAGVMMLLSH